MLRRQKLAAIKKIPSVSVAKPVSKLAEITQV